MELKDVKIGKVCYYIYQCREVLSGRITDVVSYKYDRIPEATLLYKGKEKVVPISLLHYNKTKLVNRVKEINPRWGGKESVRLYATIPESRKTEARTI